MIFEKVIPENIEKSNSRLIEEFKNWQRMGSFIVIHYCIRQLIKSPQN